MMKTRDAHTLAQALEEVLKRTRGYDYATVPENAAIAATRVLTDQDAFISSEPEVEAVRNLLARGYRWIRTDSGWAVFEKIINQ